MDESMRFFSSLILLGLLLGMAGCASTEGRMSAYQPWYNDLNPAYEDEDSDSDWSIVDIGPKLLTWPRDHSSEMGEDFNDFW